MRLQRIAVKLLCDLKSLRKKVVVGMGLFNLLPPHYFCLLVLSAKMWTILCLSKDHIPMSLTATKQNGRF